MDGERVRFSFCSVDDRQYCTGYGVWLELYVYIAAKKSGVFDDVKLGTMIDWNAYDGVVVAGNEIDVILMEQSLPVFISCKLRSADTAALNELLIAKNVWAAGFPKGSWSHSAGKKPRTAVHINGPRNWALNCWTPEIFWRRISQPVWCVPSRSMTW